MWTKEWPTEPGWYWFYGTCTVDGVEYGPEYHSVEVVEDWDIRVRYRGLERYSAVKGWWQKAILPDPPEEVEV